MLILQMLQFRSVLPIALLFFATATISCAQGKATRVTRAPSVKELVSELPNSREDGITQITFDQLIKPEFNGYRNVGPSILIDAQTKRVAALNIGSLTSAGRHNKYLVFEYHSSGMDSHSKESEDVFVSIAMDGRTQVVRYGAYNPAVIAVYGGTLPEIERIRLVARAESLIAKASDINKPYIGSCDADSFELSLINRSLLAGPSTRPNTICLLVMPKEIRDFIEEMRILWKRMKESPLAYSYARTFPANWDYSKAVKGEAKPFISIRTLSPKLKDKVRAMIKETPKFSAVSQTEYERLMALTSGSSRFHVIAKRDSYFFVEILLSRSRKSATKG